MLREYYTITELTREFGISTRTLRFYEDEGLLHPERRGRTRLFRAADRHLLDLILRGKRLGFSISEIRDIIKMYSEPPADIGQLELLVKQVNATRQELAQKQRDIEEALSEMDRIEEICIERIAELGVST